MIVCSAIFTSHVIVQRLTDYLWIGGGRVIDDDHVIRIARMLDALRYAITDLSNYYKTEMKLSYEIQISRFFSVANAYTHKDGNSIRFRYVRPLTADDTSCIIFPAEEEGDCRQVRGAVW